ncbi:MAG TPA: hypothetical protein VH092_35850 [Urbifossiella sp.]|jgi:hypothetical protein|nr:hypothetical protein [Urbifossiella sp.]
MLSGERAREIRGWLRELVTREQAEARYADLERAALALTGTNGGGWLDSRQKITAEVQPGDELWLYDTGAEAWARPRGGRGAWPTSAAARWLASA